MKSIIAVLILSFVSINASATVSPDRCRHNANKVVNAIEKTYKNPASLEFESFSENRDEGEYIYVYLFDYIIPYDDTGRGQMLSKIIEVRTTNWDCSAQSVNMRRPE